VTDSARDPDVRDQFQQLYRQGKRAFEGGRYRESIECFDRARQLLDPFTRQSGDAKIWLITAHHALGQTSEAIALCQQLAKHPHSEIRRQSQNLLAILQAPRLQRPQEWMTEIPDLASLEPSDPRERRTWSGGAGGRDTDEEPDLSPPPESVPTNLSAIWVALAAVLLLVAGTVWLG